MPVQERTLDGPHGTLPVRLYTPEAYEGVGAGADDHLDVEADHHVDVGPGPGLVWVHGGSFSGGDLDMPEADTTARRLAEHGVTVVSVDYRLAPLAPETAEATGQDAHDGTLFPIASDEVIAAFTWAVGLDAAAGPWALGGASAGGNLATGAILELLRRGGPVPALAVLAYPTLHAVQDAPDAALRAALDADAAADVFGAAAVLAMYENYLGGPVDDADIRAVPGRATADELTGFPPTILELSEVDELRVSGESFARSLRDAGVEVDLVVEPGTVHGHLNDPAHPGARASVDRLAARILALRTREP